MLITVARSNSKEVTLTDVERDTSGEFKCEVSADAPLFHTDIRSAKLLVADIPEDGPVLRTEVHKAAPGARIRANCTTPGSYPGMNITWFINDKEMHSTYGVHIQQTILSFEALPGLDTVQSSLSIRATPDLFVGGKLKMRCSATMFDLYDMSREEEIQEDAPQLALIMVPTVIPSKGTTFQMGFCRYIRMSIFLYFVHIHAWLRNVLNQ